MRKLYAFSNRNPSLPVQTFDDDVDNVRIVRRTYNTNNVERNENKVLVRKTTNNIVENHSSNVDYVETDNVYLNEGGRCPYVRFPWWLWLLLALGLLSLIGLALGLGLGLGLRRPSVNSRCSGTTCPTNAQCINNRCECNSGYFYDYSTSACNAYRQVGMTCTTSNTATQCITNAYCASNGYCVCNTNYFLDQNNGQCTALLARYTPCASDDQCQSPFVCKVSLCDCNATSYYYSSSSSCIRLGYVNDPCSANSQCVRTMNCSTTSCQCATDHYFDTSSYRCIRKQFIGQTCTQTYQCIDNATCTSVSPFSNQCECITGLYYETLTGVCTAQLTYLATCTLTYQCVNNLLCINTGSGLRCQCLPTQNYSSASQTCLSFGTYNDVCSSNGRSCETRYGLSCSAASGTCQCSSINYWNGSTCVALRYSGQSCSATSQCISDSTCTSSVCKCNTNYYYSTISGICTPVLSYGATCVVGNYQCTSNLICYDLTTSGTPDTCTCDATYYYFDSSSCTAYATHNQACSSSTYGPICNTQTLGLYCSGSTCVCPSTTYYNGSSCVSYRSSGFSCTLTSQCITNAYCNSSGVCTCSSSYYFDTTTGVCTLKRTYLQSCTATVQCSSNMICTSSTCVCTSTTYYSSSTTSCVTRATYNSACSGTTVPCDATLGLVCTSDVCKCSSTQYWSTLSNGTQVCANLRTLGQSCSSDTACVNSPTPVKCVTSICECDSSGYFLNRTTVQCNVLKVSGTPCTYNFECSSLNCNSTASPSQCDVQIVSSITSNVSQASSHASFKQIHPNRNQIFFPFFIPFVYFILIF